MSAFYRVLGLLVWSLLLFIGFQVYGSTGHDDPHINFWFAQTLLGQGEMVNYNGDRFEQTTSLLLVFLTVLFKLVLPFDLITCGYLVDVASAVACCALVMWLARRLCPLLEGWPSLLMLSSTSFMLWVFGGMGSVLAAFILLSGVAIWWVYLEARVIGFYHHASLGFVTLTLVLVRPEMPFVIIAIAMFSLFLHWRDKVKFRRALSILCVCMVATFLLFAWQRFYFLSWLPQPVLAKQSGRILEKLSPGFVYVVLNSLANPVIVLSLLMSLPFLIRLVWKSSNKPSQSSGVSSVDSLWVLLLGSLLVYVGFVWMAGGDWMQAGRFMVPVVPVSALLVTAMLLSLARNAWLANVLLLLLVSGNFYFNKGTIEEESHGVPAWVRYRILPDQQDSYGVFEKLNQEHLRDMAVIDHLREIIPQLHSKLGRPVRLISTQGGMVFYYLAKEFPGMVEFTDARALVEGSFTLCPVLNSLDRTSMGLAFSYADFFQMQAALEEQCQMYAPDIVYDLNALLNDLEPMFLAAGYVMVHQEEGYIVSNDTYWRANRLFVPNIICVKNSLLPFLEHPEKRVIDYKAIPLQQRWLYSWAASTIRLFQ